MIQKIITHLKKPRVITSAIVGLIYTLIFKSYYFVDSSYSQIILPLIGITIPILIAYRIPKNIDKKFYQSLIKNILVFILIGISSELIINYLGFYLVFIGFYISTRKKKNETEFSFNKYAWNQFKKNKIAVVSLYTLLLLIMIALFAPYLANDAPIKVKFEDKTIYPAYEIEKYKRSTDISITTKNKIRQEVQKESLSKEDEKIKIKQLEDEAKIKLMPKLKHPISGDMTSYAKIDWKEWEERGWIKNIVWAPITYSPQSIDFINSDYKHPNNHGKYKNLKNDLSNAIKSNKSIEEIEKIKDEINKSQKYITYENDTIDIPNKHRHWLGTGPTGRDLSSGLIHATRISLSIGIISMGIAALIGIILGALAGFFGDDRLKMRRGKYYLTLLGIIIGIFYGYAKRKYIISDSFSNAEVSSLNQILLSFIIIVSIIILFRLLSKLITNKWLNQEINVPVDTFVSRGIELLNSIPRLLLIITVSAVMKERSLFIIMIIIGLTSWTGIARFTRAELLRIRSLEFVQASSALGFSSIRTIFKHALPNALAPVFVSIAFGIASAILIESSLSFLNIGVPTEQVTWGSLLNLGRLYPQAWWLIIYPGLAIFITITVYNMIAEASRDALDPKLKS
tara:strand:- start:3296 stop:5173 length:1878 start_codon:yes stop_codon:yes gene_type:complete